MKPNEGESEGGMEYAGQGSPLSNVLFEQSPE